MDRTAADAYLNRIGAAPVDQPDLQTLRRLQYQHLLTVPFENLSIHLGEPIHLDEDALFEKVVGRRRGGFCYELNGAFAMLLTALGYRVSYLAARVFSGKVPGPPLDHLALRVDLDRPYLVDVGFGALSNHPLLLDSRNEQHDRAGRFRLAAVESGEVDLLMNDKP
ncbi:MAG: arylamine N-acetyltransferase, partial [Mycobacterium sp.]|nr:arylamine N-acetyltransferase [Mycobacterium sp.]